MGLEYSITNENPNAIISGLDLQKEDIVLGILNDALFAMLEFCDKVYAVDTNSDQIKHGEEKIYHLNQGEYDKFFINAGEGYCDKIVLKDKGYSYENQLNYLMNYFSFERLKRICSKLDNLHLAEKNIFSLIDYTLEFNKLYLSSLQYLDYKKYDSLEILPKGVLVYLTQNPKYCPDGFRIDEEKTGIARSHEGRWWNPVVWIKE